MRAAANHGRLSCGHGTIVDGSTGQGRDRRTAGFLYEAPVDMTVSVVVIFLDAERFITEAVDSILAQTHSAWELLLVDDGSRDGSTAIARRLANAHPERIRYLEHPGHENRGMSASRNLGIAHARGEYLAFLDADDVWLPDKLGRQLAVLRDHPDVGMVFGPLHFWYGWTGRAEDAQRDFVCSIGDGPDRVIRPPEMLLRQIRVRDGLPGVCSVLLRREVALAVGGFEESFRGMYEDEAFFSKVALRTPAYRMSESYDRYRQHPDSHCARAVAAGEYDMDPRVANPARGRFLLWLDAYVARTRPSDSELRRAIAAELWPYRHPQLARVRRYAERARPRAVVAIAKRTLRALIPAPVRQRVRAALRPQAPGS